MCDSAMIPFLLIFYFSFTSPLYYEYQTPAWRAWRQAAGDAALYQRPFFLRFEVFRLARRGVSRARARALDGIEARTTEDPAPNRHASYISKRSPSTGLIAIINHSTVASHCDTTYLHHQNYPSTRRNSISLLPHHHIPASSPASKQT